MIEGVEEIKEKYTESDNYDDIQCWKRFQFYKFNPSTACV